MENPYKYIADLRTAYILSGGRTNLSRPVRLLDEMLWKYAVHLEASATESWEKLLVMDLMDACDQIKRFRQSLEGAKQEVPEANQP